METRQPQGHGRAVSDRTSKPPSSSRTHSTGRASSGDATEAAAAAINGSRVTICPGHSRPVRQIQFSEFTPDGLFFVSAPLDKLPMLRDGATGDWIGTFKGHKGAVWSVAVDDNATVAATGSADFTAKVWDATSGQELHHFDHPHIVKSVHLTPDASKLLTGCNDGKIRVFDLSKPREEPLIFNPGDKPTLVRWLRNSKHSSDGKSLLSASVTGDICQWDLSTSTEKPVKTFKVGEEIHDVEICSQFGLMGVASGTTVQFISLNTFELVKKCTLSHQIESVSLHPKQKDTFVVGGDDLWIHVFDYETCEEIATLKGHHGPVHTVRYAPDGGVYASGSEDGTIRMWPHTRQFCS